jgi:hypothetical protein
MHLEAFSYAVTFTVINIVIVIIIVIAIVFSFIQSKIPSFAKYSKYIESVVSYLHKMLVHITVTYIVSAGAYCLCASHSMHTDRHNANTTHIRMKSQFLLHKNNVNGIVK